MKLNTRMTLPWVPEPQFLLFFGSGTQGRMALAVKYSIIVMEEKIATSCYGLFCNYF